MIPIWREAARANLRAIITYIAERNPRAAIDLSERIGECVERLGEHPFLYRPGRVPGTREAVAHPNYILVYRLLATWSKSSTSCTAAGNIRPQTRR